MCSSDPLTGDVLHDVTTLVAERNRIDAELARRVRDAENQQAAERDGLKSMPSWLRGHARLSAAEAARLVRNGRALAHLPVLGEAHDAGLVSAEQVAVARIVTPERLEAAAAAGVDLGEVDAVLTGVAIEHPYADFVAVVRRYLADLDPDGPEPDPTEGRSLVLAKHADGSLSGRFHLDPVGGEKFQATIEAHVQADRPAGDERSRAQRQGDALVQVCDNSLAAGSLPILRTVKPHVAVVIDHEDLVDDTGGPDAGRMGFGATISAARARWLACDATVSRVVMGPDGAPLDLGREQRLADRRDPSAGTRRELASGGGRRGPFTGGPRCTTSCTGSTVERPAWPTPRCCANGTTRRSTPVSASNDNRVATGAPGAPTAPRSSSALAYNPRPDANDLRATPAPRPPPAAPRGTAGGGRVRPLGAGPVSPGRRPRHGSPARRTQLSLTRPGLRLSS